MTYFTADQVTLLLKPIHPRRVLARDGMSYVEGYDIKAELNRVFGFGRWDTDILSQTLICEVAKKMGNGKDGWYVAYKTSLRLTIKAPDGSEVCHYDESHVGDSTHPVQGEAHGNALTNSWTYALKRCATNLGDQFGLSLYNKGSREALVRWTLVRPEAAENGHSVDDSDVPQVEPEVQPEPQETPAATSNGHARRTENPQADDPVLGAWASKLDEITCLEDVERALQELDHEHEGGRLDRRQYGVLKSAVAAKGERIASRRVSRESAAPHGNGQQPQRPSRPKGPPATERGATAVPTGKGDNGAWVAGFLERLASVKDPDDLGGFQGQIAAAARVKTITPGKATELSAKVRERRTELQEVPA